jgi:hypothetical protein
MAKLFRIAVVLFVAIVSVTFIAVLLTGVFSFSMTPAEPQSGGISAVAGGVSEKFLYALWLVAVLCSLLVWRRRKSR